MSSNVFKNKIKTGIGTTAMAVYTSPGDKTATVIGLSLANISESNIFVSVLFYDSSTSSVAYLIKNAPIPMGGSFVPVGSEQKLVLENGDEIRVVSDTASSVDAILSVMELDGV